MSRLTTRVLSASMAACLGLSGLAVQAQPDRGQQEMRHGGRYDDRGDRGDRYGDRRDEHRDERRFDRDDQGRGAGPEHDWRRGYRVPPEYRSHHYVVDDWRAHHLSAPPRGYHWIQNGGDYLLVGIATGVILTIVLDNGY